MTWDTTQEHDGLFLLFLYVGTTELGFCGSHSYNMAGIVQGVRWKLCIHWGMHYDYICIFRCVYCFH